MLFQDDEHWTGVEYPEGYINEGVDQTELKYLNREPSMLEKIEMKLGF